MTDRELLELAAKAGGILDELIWVDSYDCGLMDECLIPLDPKIHHYAFKGSYPEREWNPLADDGDALRLAVKLKMFVCTPDCDDPTATARKWDGENSTEEVENGDPYAATRRAIVRAAAEIGRNMK